MGRYISKALNYLLFYLLVLFSLQPFWWLYILSKPLSFLLYRVFKYRRKVVEKNLSDCFADHDTEKIGRKFYSFLSEMVLETVKCLTIRKKSLLKRITCQNPDVIEKYAAKNQSVILMSAHYGNWEYLIYAMNVLFTPLAIGVGKPLTNDVFNKLTNAKRAKYGMKIINAKTIKEEFKKDKDVLTANLFLADQYMSKGYKTTFLEKETFFAYGAEKYAVEYNFPVVYADVFRVKRGRYELKLIDISENPATTKYGEIMNRYIELLETTINRDPAYWLWSHKRWKNIEGFYRFNN